MSVGYSGTPLVKKLGIKPGHRVMVLNAPVGFKLDHEPVITRATGLADVILSFHTDRRELETRMPALHKKMVQNAGLWIAWPKQASKQPTDITEDVVREIAFQIPLVDNKVCAIDETWSGLRLVIRVKDRLP